MLEVIERMNPPPPDHKLDPLIDTGVSEDVTTQHMRQEAGGTRQKLCQHAIGRERGKTVEELTIRERE